MKHAKNLLEITNLDDKRTLAANSATDGRSVSMPAGPLPPPMPGRPACCEIKPNCCRNGDDLLKSCLHGPRREKLRMRANLHRYGHEVLFKVIRMAK